MRTKEEGREFLRGAFKPFDCSIKVTGTAFQLFSFEVYDQKENSIYGPKEGHSDWLKNDRSLHGMS